MKTRNLNSAGFTLVEIMIVVAIIGLLATIAIPNYVRARTTSQRNSCINNLRQIQGATQIWALESKASASSTVTYDDISSYLKSSVSCPAAGSDTTFNGSYELNGVTNQPTCRILGNDPVNPHVLPATAD